VAPVPTDGYTNVDPGVQVLQVVVTTLQGCSIQSQVSLRVLPVPEPDNPNPLPIEVCDGSDGTDPLDGLDTFVDATGTDLISEAIATLLGGQQPNIDVLV